MITVYSVVALILVFAAGVFNYLIFKWFNIEERIKTEGPLVWATWVRIWKREDLTIISKILLISFGFTLYVVNTILSMYYLKWIFIKEVK